MWLIFAILFFGAATALAAWLLGLRAWRAWARYESRVQHEARRTLDAAFLFLDVARLWSLAWAAGLGLILLGAWAVGHWWLALPLLGLLLWLPGEVMRCLRRRRARQFDAQLPDLVQALAGALRAGAGLQPALQHIIAQSRPPLAQEFSLVLREQRLGVGLHEALAQLRQRMPTESCGLVVSALGIAARTGGSLGDTLESIAQTLRAREHWLGRVRALTAQGRMQSRIMASLPLLLLAVLTQLEPEPMARLWQTPAGWATLLAILVLEVTGIVWIRRVVAIEV